MKVKVERLSNFDNSLEMPEYKSEGASGMDIRACLKEEGTLVVKPGERVCVPTGLRFEFEQGVEMQVRPRSGLSLKSDLLVCNSPGTVDSDYRGELMIIIGNFGDKEHRINHGDRIAQIVFAPVLKVSLEDADELSDTSRGDGGFGSTGLK